MTNEFFKIEINFFDHAKVVDLSDAAFRLHLTAIAYANRLMTDGFIAANIARRLIDHDPLGQGCSWTENVKELLEARLWHEVDGGYQIHDFLDHNTPRDERLRKREAERERKARYRGNQRASASASPNGVPSGQDDVSRRDAYGTEQDRAGQGRDTSQKPPKGAIERRDMSQRDTRDDLEGDPAERPTRRTHPQVNPVDVSQRDSASPSDGTSRLRDAPIEVEVEVEVEAETKSKTVTATPPRQVAAASPPALTVIDGTTPTPQTYVAELVDKLTARGSPASSRDKGQAARQYADLVRDGFGPDDVRAGTDDWLNSNQHVATLTSFITVHARGGRPRAGPNKAQRQLDAIQQTHDQMRRMRPEEPTDELGTVDADRRQAERQLPRPADQRGHSA